MITFTKKRLWVIQPDYYIEHEWFSHLKGPSQSPDLCDEIETQINHLYFNITAQHLYTILHLTSTHFKSWMSIINVWILWHSTHFRIPISTCFCFIFQKKKSNKQTFCNYVLIQSSLAQFQLFVRTLNVNIHKQAAVCLKISQLIKVTADSLSPQILMRRLNVPCRELLKRTSSALVLCGTILFSVMST